MQRPKTPSIFSQRPRRNYTRTPAPEATPAAELAAGASTLAMDTVVGQLVAGRIEAGQELLRDV